MVNNVYPLQYTVLRITGHLTYPKQTRICVVTIHNVNDIDTYLITVYIIRKTKNYAVPKTVYQIDRIARI